jgi:hypothetical protein
MPDREGCRIRTCGVTWLDSKLVDEQVPVIAPITLACDSVGQTKGVHEYGVSAGRGRVRLRRAREAAARRVNPSSWNGA